ncbi:hypothetical protein PRIC1_006865 [Phytophthora ramorum]
MAVGRRMLPSWFKEHSHQSRIYNISWRNLMKTTAYDGIQKSMQTLCERSLPQSKKAIAGIFTMEERETDIRYVFPRWFVTKAQNAITQFRNGLDVDCDEDVAGVRVPRFGIYMLKDINAMARWHCVMENLEKAKEAANWAVNTATKRISVPAELSDGVVDDTAEREHAIKRMKLHGGRSTVFGSLPYVSLLSLCGSRWADDVCMGHGQALLQREHKQIGIIDPIFHRFRTREDKLRHVSTGDLFNTANSFVLLALHVDNNHWCGVVFDFRRQSKSITVFDPLQAPKSKYYNMCGVLLQDLFGEMCKLMIIKKETKLRQPDVASCGVMVLMFFEWYLRGIEMPLKPSPALLCFMRLRYLLKCIP